MAKAVFYHKPGSKYDDVPSTHYHFPHQYLGRVRDAVGDYVVYYGPTGSERGYWATAIVSSVREDENMEGHYYADLHSYIDFDRFVPYRENGGYEKGLFTSDGRVSGGRAVQAVRMIPDQEFVDIVEAGLGNEILWPEDHEPTPNDGFSDIDQLDLERPIVEQLTKRPFRDIKFRHNVRKAYDRTCAFTGLRLINGRGRPEVQAAHIIPVEKNGPDSINNGIALSGTVHWMFDRGLLSLSDDFTILTSTHLNYDVSTLLLSDKKALVPKSADLRPHPYFLDWHRRNRFKQ